jgi:hypothetical protein
MKALALAALLGSASAASAEGAWVLWTMGYGHLGFDLGARDAYETKSDCRAAAYAYVRSLVRAANAERAKRDKEFIPSSELEDRMVEHTMAVGNIRCLPDTVDPRGSKVTQ